MTNGSATYNTNFTPAANGFTREGYIFTGWNEKADGTGTAWTAGTAKKYTKLGDMTLYAQWTAANYGEYNGNTWVKGFMTLAEATEGSASGHTIKALIGVTETTGATVAQGKTLTFDLNGKTTTLNKVQLTNNGTLTITGSTGKLSGTNSSGAIFNRSTGKLVVSGGTITGTNITIYNQGSGNTKDSPSLKITGGTIESNGVVAIRSYTDGMVYMTGGTINGNKGCIDTNSASAKIVIEGGSITATNGTAISGSNGTVNVSGNSTSITGQTGIDTTTGTVIITGGTVTGTTSYGVYASGSSATVTIGTDDNTVSIESPKITGANSGILNVGGTINFYDGIIKGKYQNGTGRSINGTVSDTPDGYGVLKTNANSIETAILSKIYTVTYNKNSSDATGTMNSQTIMKGESFTPAASGFTRTGYNFSKWNTKADGTGTDWTPGVAATYTANENITLYAQWTANTYTINFYQGKGTATPEDERIGSMSVNYGSSVTLTKYEDLEATFPQGGKGWKFGGWSTTNTGTDRNYTDGRTFTYNLTQDLNLYAVGVREYTFCSGISAETYVDGIYQYWNPHSTDNAYLTTVNVPAAKAISGWTFLGYRAGDAADGTVVISASNVGNTDYKPGVTELSAFDFRAKYSREVAVSYNKNGGNGTMANTTATQYYNSGYSKTAQSGLGQISTPSFTLANNTFTRTGYSFSKWAEGSTSGTKYDEGATYTGFKPAVNSSETTKAMYAVWTANKYTVSFNANGGTGGQSANVTATYNAAMPTISTTAPTRTGYTFQGWYDNSNYAASGAKQYYTAAGASARSYDKTSNTTLYAGWKINEYTLTINPDGGSFNGTTSNTTVKQNYGTTYSVANNPTKAGYVFTGWTLSGSGSFNYYDTSITPTDTTTVNYNSASSTTPSPYNNSGGGTVTNAMVADSTATGGYSLKITTNGTASPGAGGIYLPIYSTTPGRINVLEIKAKIPTGYNLQLAGIGYHYTGIGSAYRHNDVAGNGNWKTYYMVVYTGDTGSFGATAHLNLTGTNNTSVSWNINSIVMKSYTKEQFKSIYTFGAGNGTLTANWAASGAKVTFNANNGTFDTTYVKNWKNGYFVNNSSSAYRYYYYNTAYGTYPGDTDYNWTPDPRVTSREGYTLDGWYTSATGGTKIFNSNGTLVASVSGYSDSSSKWIKYDENITLYAHWTASTYTITLNNQNATTAGATAIYEKYNTGYYTNSGCTTQMTTSANGITVPTKTGYTFGGYYTATNGGGTQYIDASGKLTSSASTTNFSAAGNLYAKWTVNQYEVTCEDWFVDASNSRKTKLGTQAETKQYDYGSSANGSAWGTSTTKSAYYKNYVYKSSTSATVGTSGATVYRYFWAWTDLNIYYAGGSTQNGATVSLSVDGTTWNDVSNESNTVQPAGTTYYIKNIRPKNATEELDRVANLTWDSTNSYYTYTPTAAGTSMNIWMKYKTYTITLNNQSATTAGTTTIYEKYNTGYYTNSGCTTQMTTSANGITKPARTYTVTYNYNGATGGNSSATATSTYTFGGYYTETGGSGTQYIDANGKLTSSASATNFSAAGNLYAKWTGGTVTLPTPTKTGYTFGGWYKESALTNSAGAAGASYAATANITLYAKWTVKQYVLSKVTDNTNLLANGTFDAYTTVAAPSKTANGVTHTWDGTLNGIPNDPTHAYNITSWGTGANMGVPIPEIGYHAHMRIVNGNNVLRFKTNEDYAGKTAADVSGGVTVGNTAAIATGRWLGISQRITASKFTAGSKYTLTMDVYRVSGTSYVTGGLYYKTNANKTEDFRSGQCALKPTTTGQWQTLSWTFTLDSDYLNTSNPALYLYGMNGGAGELYIDNVRLEAAPTESNKNYDAVYTSTELATPTRSGYTFKGWYNNGSYSTQLSTSSKFNTSGATFENVATAGTRGYIYAKWMENNYLNTDTNTYYDTLASALSAVANNQTIKVMNSRTETTAPSLASGKTGVKLDMNGKTTTLNGVSLTNNGGLDIYNSSSTEGILQGTSFSVITNQGTLTTNNTSSTNKLTIAKTESVVNKYNIIENNHEATFNTNTYIKGGRGGYAIYTSGDLTIAGANITSSSSGIQVSNSNGKVSVTSGTINTSGTAINVYASTAADTANIAVEITGGTIISTSGSAITNVHTKNIVVINGGTITSNTNDISVVTNNSTGIINIIGGEISSQAGVVVLNNGRGTINISGGTITSEDSNLITNINGTINISGGLISSNYSSGAVIDNAYSGTINISGGTISNSGYGVWNERTGTINISGGTITATNSDAVWNFSTGTGTINISETASITSTEGYGVNNAGSGSLEITGGNITSTNNFGINMSKGTLNITGGTITGSGYGVYINDSTVVFTLGTDDGTVTSSATAKPEIIATKASTGIGVHRGAGTFNFYDGVVKGAAGKSIDATVSDTPEGYGVVKTTSGSVETAILVKQTKLMTGGNFNKAIKGTSSYTTSDTKIKSIIFGNTSDYLSNSIVAGIENVTPIVVDVDNLGLINAYKVGNDTDGYAVYVLSDNTIYANEDSSYMFYNCKGLTSLDVTKLNTANVTSMSNMFYYCSGLTSLDVTKLNTANVTDMNHMFYNCSGLTSLDVTKFDTAKVINMSYMFYNCSGLTSLDVSKFDTAKVTLMDYMFGDCSGLTSLDVTKFDTAKVTNMEYMFYNCSGLTSLDVSKFDTANVKIIRYMFCNCSGLTSLDVSKFDTAKVTLMGSMFHDCSGLTSLDVSKFDTANVTDMSRMFFYCSGLTSLDVSKFNTSKVTYMSFMFDGCSGLTSLDVSKFDTANVTDMDSMFYNCSGLTSLDVSKFDTANVKNMSSMFRSCNGLTSLDVTNFDTAKVVSMEYMFGYSGLTSLDVSNFDISNVTNTQYMFDDCTQLVTIYANSDWNTGYITKSTAMFFNCTKLVGAISYDSGKRNIQYANPTTGYFTTKMVTLKTGQTFNSAIKGTSYSTQNTNIKKVIFARTSKYAQEIQGVTGVNVDSANSGEIKAYKVSDGNGGYIVYVLSDSYIVANSNSSDLFSNLKGVEEFDFTNFDIRNVTNASNMFKNCSAIETIYSKKGGWDVSNITTSTNMFTGCTNLKGAIDYNASKVDKNYANPETGYFTYEDTLKKGTDIIKAIKGGSATYSTQDTAVKKVIFGRPFEYAAEIASLSSTETAVDIGGLGTINLYRDTTNGIVYILSPYRIYANANSSYMFANLRGLTDLTLNNFYTANVTNMSYMFQYCGYTAMEELNLGSNFDTSNVKDMRYMFQYCGYTAMEELNLGSNFDTSNVTNMSSMFSNCGYTAMASLDLGNKFDTSNVTNMSYMFDSCGRMKMTSLNLGSNFNTSNVTDMNYMFNYCGRMAMTSLNLGNSFNTSKVTDMNHMFYYCTKLTSIDVSSFNMSKVTNTSYMFQGCSELVTIYANSDWNTGKITNSTSMFSNCTKLVGAISYTYGKTDIQYANPTTGYFTIKP